jgi:hypothetical protein
MPATALRKEQESVTSLMQESLDTETALGSSMSGYRTWTALRQKWIQSQQLAGVDPETALIGCLEVDQRQHKGGRQ